MDDFTKIVRIGTLPDYAPARRKMNVFCRVQYTAGRLSITGVEGPLSRGDCRGSCGQIDMHLREPGGLDGYVPAEGWDIAKVRRFLDVWEEFHMNDTRPYDAEMKAAGWPERARVPMLGVEFTLTDETLAAKKVAEAMAIDAVKAGQTFTPTPGQAQAAALPYSVTIWAYEADGEPPAPEFYRRAKAHYGRNAGGLRAPEKKTLGWLRPSEHPDGLLTRKLREDGPGYGSAWFPHPVPDDVLQWLAALPDTDIQPAWI